MAELQRRLELAGYYRAPVDGRFGAVTERALREFQRDHDLAADGIAGPATWALLVGATGGGNPWLAGAPIARRCLALTGSFETGRMPPGCFAGLAGDFDGQGLSLGACQWSLGQGTLQPLLQDLTAEHPDLVARVLRDRSAEWQAMLRASRAEQLAWAHSIQDVRGAVREPWRGLLTALCYLAEFQAIQEKHARGRLVAAARLCDRYGLASERALALMFDIEVQNGGIPLRVHERIEADLARLHPTGDPDVDEVARLRAVAERRAAAANPRWAADVRARKLAIANGEGVVHGRRYRLLEQFGIGLRAFDRSSTG